MNCDKCGKTGMTAQELSMHNKYFHDKKNQLKQVATNGICPDCGTTLIWMEGCVSCPGCGYSKCS